MAVLIGYIADMGSGGTECGVLFEAALCRRRRGHLANVGRSASVLAERGEQHPRVCQTTIVRLARTRCATRSSSE